MAAGVLEHADLAIAIPHQKQRHAKEIDRFGVTRFRYVLAEPDAGPIRKEDQALFLLENGRVRVMGVRQAMGPVHGLKHVG